MPRSNDPERSGGKYVVTWTDWQGKTQAQERATLGQARALMRDLRGKGLTPRLRKK